MRPFALLLLLWGASSACAQTDVGPGDVASGEVPTGGVTSSEVAPEAVATGLDEPVVIPPAPSHFMGRRIATTMHWQGAPWLLRETREEEEHAARLLAALAVEPGMTICDLGSGNGFHTLPLARLVGEGGAVWAVDIQQPMLDMLAERVEAEGLDNVVLRLGNEIDPMLPARAVDLILLVDVYHEMSHPEPMLARMHAALAPGGRIALVEFRGEDPDVPIKPLHKMTRAQAIREYEAHGFRAAGSFDELPWQHLLFFVRDDEPASGPGTPR